jgi:methionyl-tRNA formyltransferase
MYMAEELDAGDILLARALPLGPGETGGGLHDRLAALAPGALLEALDLLEAARAPRIPQDQAAVTYAGKLDRDRGRIDFAEGSERIARKVRAFDPWPSAHTTVPGPEGQRLGLKIFGARAEPGVPCEPGRIEAVTGEAFGVGTGDGVLWVTSVQLEGRKRMVAAQFLRGHPLAVGARLG